MSNIEEVKNNKTKVEEILDQIKSLDKTKDIESCRQDFNGKIKELKEAIANRDKELDEKNGNLEDKLETRMAEMVEKITGAFPTPDKQTPIIKKYGNNFGEFLLKVRQKSMDIKDLGGSDGATGGYLVPEEYMKEILKVELEKSVVRSSGARVIPMMGDTMKIPALNMVSNASGSMFGGVTAYWTEENATKTESEPKFKRVKLEPKKLCAYTEASDELNNDSVVSMGSLLSNMFGEVLAFEEDYAFLTGDGVGKPLGVTNSPAYVTISRNSGSVVVTDDIIDMISRFKGNLSRAKFVINQSSLPYIYKLMDGNDNYIWHPGMSGSISEAAPGTLYGIPIVVSEKVPALGTTGDVMLCDFGYYLIGDRQQIRVEESSHFKFQTDQTVWRAVCRVDGQPWLDSAITPRAGGSTLSPFVGIS